MEPILYDFIYEILSHKPFCRLSMQTNEENVILKFTKPSLLYDLIATSSLTHIKKCVTYVSVHQEKDKMMNFVIIKRFQVLCISKSKS